MTQLRKQPYLLLNPIQHYIWGSKGKRAYIPTLLGFEPENDLPYAELWIGAHAKASSIVKLEGSSITLEKLVCDHPHEILGGFVMSKYGGKFPFLLKILSAAEILSIQVHPTKTQAISLFAEDPLHYSDDNHKPELAVAIDSLSALIGFKTVEQINNTILEYPELKDLVNLALGNAVIQRESMIPFIRETDFEVFFSAILSDTISIRETITSTTKSLYQRLLTKTMLTELEELFIRLYPVYWGDVGLWLMFLMNLVHLKMGQAIYIGAGIPHAYIKGNIIECMANSDNVVRAGLTDKFKDTKTLVKVVDFKAQPTYPPVKLVGSEIIYNTPVEEFQISRINLNKGKIEINSEGKGPVILFVLRGRINISWELNRKNKSQEYHQGDAVLIPAFLVKVWVNSMDAADLIKAIVPPEN